MSGHGVGLNHCDVGRRLANVRDAIYIASPVAEVAVLVGLSDKDDSRVGRINKSTFSRLCYLAPVTAGGREAAPPFVQFEAGSDGAGVVYSNGGRGIMNISDGTYIAGPFHEVVVFMRDGSKVDHFR